MHTLYKVKNENISVKSSTTKRGFLSDVSTTGFITLQAPPHKVFLLDLKYLSINLLHFPTQLQIFLTLTSHSP
jgi:hypothetical protein